MELVHSSVVIVLQDNVCQLFVLPFEFLHTVNERETLAVAENTVDAYHNLF
jgi:hypothetical protein